MLPGVYQQDGHERAYRAKAECQGRLPDVAPGHRLGPACGRHEGQCRCQAGHGELQISARRAARVHQPEKGDQADEGGATGDSRGRQGRLALLDPRVGLECVVDDAQRGGAQEIDSGDLDANRYAGTQARDGDPSESALLGIEEQCQQASRGQEQVVPRWHGRRIGGHAPHHGEQGDRPRDERAGEPAADRVKHGYPTSHGEQQHCSQDHHPDAEEAKRQRVQGGEPTGVQLGEVAVGELAMQQPFGRLPEQSFVRRPPRPPDPGGDVGNAYYPDHRENQPAVGHRRGHVSAQASVKIGLRQLWLLCLACVWLAGAAYVMHVLDRKWIPHDDGSLAQAAERVLLGEMPHRDFADLYTGGLSLLDALAFRAFGIRLMALRYVLFLFFLAWVPAFYYCASRWVSPAGAALATLLAIVWTLPNYPAAMPSWYNLFFATFGAAALFRFTETGRRGWLAAAGALGGLSLLIKIAGLYYIAACLLFLVAYEALTRDESPPGPGGRLYRGLVVTGLAGLLLAVVALIRRHLSVEQVYHFFLPTAMLASLVARVVASSAGIDSPRAMRRLWSLVWPFAVGLAVPIVGFLVPYVAHGDVGALLRGVFVNPTTRIAAAARAPLPWTKILSAGILAAFIGLAVRAGRGAW